MSKLTLTKTKFQQAVWEGLLSGGSGATPDIEVSHQGSSIPDVTVEAIPDAEGDFALRVPIPAEAVSDGMQSLLIVDTATDTQIGAITLMAGEALADDLRVEVDLLRAELDMLKRAFRRHCLETS